ncbi:MAG TPA: valine--tRNA ligase [Gemmatimonadales bacterium]|nr:valine--tRNA ligase [Gemmatimonadales bacterium]
MTAGAPLAPQYLPKGLETPLYEEWEKRGVFRPASDAESGREPGPSYVIMMPPPNVTANLHMGHGLTYTVQDVLIRFERMRGRDTLWLPGTDHAGIATQNVVEKLLAQEGRTRFDLGRAAFEQRVWEYVRETGSTILRQLRALGASCDWERTYFTLDPGLSRAVREVFVSLYERGLVYRGKYIINWCPRCLTALSNEEAEKHETDGRIWYLRYPLEAGGHLVVATTRPETMLGDTGVAVHPDDPRYRDLVGSHVRLPLADRRIPVVADEAVDPEFGTGAVKVTPAHDPADFEIARRTGLEAIDVLTPEARMSDAVPERFRGLDRYEARERVIDELDRAGLVEKREPHRHSIGRCYRCDTVVEPRLSDQWFVKMAPLAAPALEAYRDGRVRFIPEHRGTEYELWLTGIRDWCISRQLWWGHRIPVWYCDAPGCGRTTASRTDLAKCPGCGGPVRQDEDVLDTWFSSQLVPFSSLGWPEQTADLRRFYPGDTLVTAPEILFFWVARMIMIGLEFMGEVPYRTVYLHGTVRDMQHRKMSKSLGNGIDPLDVVRDYGADALRYTVVSGLAVGNDLLLDHRDLETTFAPGRNFANKLWNVGRLILSHLPEPARPLAGDHPGVVARDELTLPDRWIIARCEATVREATAAYERFRLNDAALALHRFIWTDLADWYLEVIKPRLYGDQPGGDVARAVVTATFEVALRLLHPVMPFITETLWRHLPATAERASIALARWPASDRRAADAQAERRFGLVQELVSAIRSIRAEYAVPPGQTIRAVVQHPGADLARALETEAPIVRRLAKLAALDVQQAPGSDEAAAGAVLSDGTAVSVPLGDLVDLERECARLTVETDRLTGLIAAQETKLSNQQFVSRAPAAVVDREREKLAAWREQAEVLTARRERLGCVS